MTDLQLLPSDVAIEVTESLAGLVERHGSRPTARSDDGAVSQIWRELANGGWTELADRSESGQTELSLLDVCAIAEGWGRLLVRVPFLQTLAVRRWLPSADRPAASERLSFAFVEGSETLVPFGDAVDQVAIGDGDGGFELATIDAPGAVDGYSPALPLVPVGSQRPAVGLMAAEWATVCLAEAVGTATQALDNAVLYVSERRQFGRPVGSFQGLKHRMADMHRDVEMARSGVVWCCAEPVALDRAAPAVLDLCSSVAETAIHVHGGFGFTWECEAHWYLRHVGALSRVVNALAGTTPARD